MMKEEEVIYAIQKRKLEYLGHIVGNDTKYKLLKSVLQGNVFEKRGPGRKRVPWLKDVHPYTSPNPLSGPGICSTGFRIAALSHPHRDAQTETTEAAVRQQAHPSTSSYVDGIATSSSDPFVARKIESAERLANDEVNRSTPEESDSEEYGDDGNDNRTRVEYNSLHF
ncbi:hypothetical protein Trydic_g23326 [Trypoxylus dichotomus]